MINAIFSDFLLNPYIGTKAYTEKDAIFFFGRTKLQQKIINNINVNRLTVLYGESGVGKSSIIHAGVANRLRLFAQENLIDPDIGVPKLAVIVYDKWQEEILDNILAQVRDEIINEFIKIEVQDKKQLKDWLIEEVQHIKQKKQTEAEQKGYYLPCDFIQELQAWIDILGKNYANNKLFTSELFIILDQFESYFLNRKKIKDWAEFDRVFTEAINLPKLSIHFLIAIRSNRFYQLEQHFGKNISTILDNCIELNYLNNNEAETAIAEPIERYNLINHINTCSLTILTGEKYSGKSLFLKLGIIPYFSQKLQLNSIPIIWLLLIKINPIAGILFISKYSSLFYPVYFKIENSDPLPNFIKHIKNRISTNLDENQKAEFCQLTNLEEILEFSNKNFKKPLIILDQFEIYLKSSFPEVKESNFVEQLSKILASPKPLAHFLISISDSSDHHDKLVQLEKLFTRLNFSWSREYFELSEDSLQDKHSQIQLAKIEDKDYFINRVLYEVKLNRLELSDELLTSDYLQVIIDRLQQQSNRGESVSSHYLQVIMERVWQESNRNENQEARILSLNVVKQIGANNFANSQEEFHVIDKKNEGIILVRVIYFFAIKWFELTVESGIYSLMRYAFSIMQCTHEKLVNEEKLVDKGFSKIIQDYVDDTIDSWITLQVKSNSDRQKLETKAAQILYYLLLNSSSQNYPSSDVLVNRANEETKALNLPLYNLNDKEVEEFLEKLNDERILRSIGFSQDDQDPKKLYEIYFDGLIPALQIWGKRYLSYLHDLVIEKGLPAQSLRQLRRGRHDLAALLAREAYEFNERDNLDMLDQIDEALRQSLSVDYFNNTFEGHEGGVTSVAFSPDEKWLASGSHDKKIMLQDLTSKKNYLFKKIAHDEKVSQVVFAPKESKILVSGSDDGTIKLWNLEKLSLENSDQDPPSKTLLWHHEDPSKDKQASEKESVTSVIFNQDGKMLASGTDNGTITLLDLRPASNLSWKDYFNADPELTANFPKPRGWRIKDNDKKMRKVDALAFRPHKDQLAFAHGNGTIYLWDLNQNNLNSKGYITIEAKEKVRSIAFNSKGNLLAVALGVQEPKIKIWRLGEKFDIFDNLGKDEDLDTVNSLAFHPKEDILVAGGEDQKVRVWDLSSLNKWDFNQLENQADKSEFNDKFKPKEDIFKHKEDILVVGGEDQKVRVWDLSLLNKWDFNQLENQADKSEFNDKFKPKIMPGRYFGVSSVAFSPKGNWLAAGSWDYAVRLWEWDRRPSKAKPSKAKPMILPGKEDAKSTHEKNVIFVAVSPDGNMIASASWDYTVGFWKRESSDQESDKEFDFYEFPKLHKERVWSVAFSPDGKFLASSGVNNYKFIAEYQKANYEISDNKVILWNIEDIDKKAKVRRINFPEQKEGISSVAFSPNGKILATGLWVDHPQEPNYHTVLLWDISKITDNDWGKGELAKERTRTIHLQHHEDKNDNYKRTVTTVVFHPTNDKIMATAGDDGIVKLWSLDKLNWDKQEADVKSISLRKHQENKKPGEKITVRSLAFSPDGKILASASEDRTIRLWDVSKFNWEGEQEPKSIVVKDYHSENSHSYWVGSVAFGKDSQGNLQLASAGYEGTIKLWNLENISEDDWKNGKINRKPISLRDHEQSVTSVAFIPNNSNSPYKLVSGSYDNTVRLWITSTKELANMVKEKVLRSLTENERKRFEIPKRDEQ